MPVNLTFNTQDILRFLPEIILTIAGTLLMVLKFKLQPLLIMPASSAVSSSTNKDQVPFGFVLVNAASCVPKGCGRKPGPFVEAGNGTFVENCVGR